MPRIPTFWPPDPSEFNYMVASTNLPLIQFYANTIITVTAVTLGYLFFCSLAGYVFAKGRFPGRGCCPRVPHDPVHPFPMQMIALPPGTGPPPQQQPRGLVLPPRRWLRIFFMRQAMQSIPDDLVDAARLDGAGEFRIYRTVMLPLCGLPW